MGFVNINFRFCLFKRSLKMIGDLELLLLWVSFFIIYDYVELKDFVKKLYSKIKIIRLVKWKLSFYRRNMGRVVLNEVIVIVMDELNWLFNRLMMILLGVDMSCIRVSKIGVVIEECLMLIV